MAPKKNPSNFDLAADIKDMKAVLMPLVSDVRILKEKEAAREIAKAAVDEYKLQEQEERSTNAQQKAVKARTDLLVKLAILVTAVTTLVITLTR